MSKASLPTPLLDDASPLDARSKGVIAGLFEREQQLMADLPTDDPLDPKRRRRVDLTLPEILEQPEVIRTTLLREREGIAAAARTIAAADIRRVYLTGCGDSLAVMVAVRSLFEMLLGIPCEPVQALDMAYYYHHTLGPGLADDHVEFQRHHDPHGRGNDDCKGQGRAHSGAQQHARFRADAGVGPPADRSCPAQGLAHAGKHSRHCASVPACARHRAGKGSCGRLWWSALQARSTRSPTQIADGHRGPERGNRQYRRT